MKRRDFLRFLEGREEKRMLLTVVDINKIWNDLDDALRKCDMKRFKNLAESASDLTGEHLLNEMFSGYEQGIITRRMKAVMEDSVRASLRHDWKTAIDDADDIINYYEYKGITEEPVTLSDLSLLHSAFFILFCSLQEGNI